MAPRLTSGMFVLFFLGAPSASVLAGYVCAAGAYTCGFDLLFILTHHESNFSAGIRRIGKLEWGGCALVWRLGDRL